MPDRTTVPRAGSTVLPPLQRSQTGPQSPEQVLQFCPLFREAIQDHSPQSRFYSSAPSSEKPDRTTVPRACSTLLPPLQRIKTRSQSVKHIAQFCPFFREARQAHRPQSRLYTSAPSSENQDRTTVPKTRSTVLSPLQRNQKAAVAAWSNAARTAVVQHRGPSEDHNFHPNHRTDRFKQNFARTQKKKKNKVFRTFFLGRVHMF